GESVAARARGHPAVRHLPPVGPERAARATPDPVFQKALAAVAYGVGLVELDRLVVPQKNSNLGFVEYLKSGLPAQPTNVDAARLAFGLDQQLAPFAIQQVPPNAFTVLSPSTDLRALEFGMVSPSQVAGF